MLSDKATFRWLSFDAHTYLLVATYYFQTFNSPNKTSGGDFPRLKIKLLLFPCLRSGSPA
nr:MAG TPA: hypothetical protein [Caudoviricetes sp.]